MSFKTFKNRNSARKHLSYVLHNLQAIDKHLKPCYLWDSFIADLVEIQNYLREIHTLGLTKLNLNAFSINDTVFVTEYENFKNYLMCFSAEGIDVVDVSKAKTEPSILSSEEKINALKPVIKYANIVLSELSRDSGSCNTNMDIDSFVCNVTTLYGALLGYPVLYWYESQSPESEVSCLSMVPLIVYNVTSTQMDNKQCGKALFSFSIPEEISNKTERIVLNWFDNLTSRCKSSGFCNLRLTQQAKTLPCVSM